MENYHVIYVWWSDNPKIKPWQNLEYPVILAIASLRLHNKNCKISVLDVSFFERPISDWEPFTSILDFQLVKWNSLLDLNLPKSSKLNSRVWDVWKYSKQLEENKIVFADSDIFWFRDPFPLDGEIDGKIKGFYANRNLGLFYFDKNCKETKKTFDLWKGLIARVLIKDNDCFQEICKVRPSSIHSFNEESAFNYIQNFFPECYNKIPPEEHAPIVTYLLYKNNINFNNLKNIHCLYQVIGRQRALIFLLFKELNLVKYFFDNNTWFQIFGKNNLNKFKKLISIKEINNISKREMADILAKINSPKITLIL